MNLLSRGSLFYGRFIALSKRLPLLIFCFSSIAVFAQPKFPAIHEIKNLVQPIRLNKDTTVLFLTDYFVSPELIDSVSLPRAFKWNWNKTEQKLTVIALKDLPPLEELKLWSGGFAYAIILKKPEKALYKFTFLPQGKSYQTVQLAGELNDWNPKKTPFTFKDGRWEAQIELNPGIYQYQIVADGKWMLDPLNHDSADNNNGWFNSVFKAGTTSADTPSLRTGKISKGSLTAYYQSKLPGGSVKFYWQNFRLDDNWVHRNADGYEVKIPEEARKIQRSFIRVFADNGSIASNDLLIPLEYGEVLRSDSLVTRNDKEANCIYFVLVDRFYDGDKSNDQKVIYPGLKDKANYYGGDLEGVLKKINDGYFQSLNVNALWISPILQNPETAFKEFPEPHDWYSGYHGYWPISLTQIDHRFGTDEVFKKLVAATHKNQINVYLDLVANHVHEDYPLIKQHPEWRTTLDLPDGRKNIRLWDEYRLTTWFDTFLPTLDFNNKQVLKLEVDSSIYWVQKFGIDGFRHDATKHIPEIFWRALTLELKKKFEIKENKTIYQLGETYGSKELIGSYIGSGMMDGQFDFNLYFDARATFAKDDVSFEKLTGTLQGSLNYYGYHNLMGNISGNHDLPRFISLAGGALSFSEDARKAGWTRDVEVGSDTAYSKLGCMIAFIATIPGVPVIYYGDEIGMPGAGDPDNRRMMKFDNLTDNEMLLKQKVAKLFKIRHTHLSLIYGDFEWLKIDKNTLAYKRSYFGETTIIIFNNDSKPREINLMDKDDNLHSAKAEFGSKFLTGANNLSVQLGAKSFEVFTTGKN